MKCLNCKKMLKSGQCSKFYCDYYNDYLTMQAKKIDAKFKTVKLNIAVTVFTPEFGNVSKKDVIELLNDAAENYFNGDISVTKLTKKESN